MHGLRHKVCKHLRHSVVATCCRSLHWVTITQLQVALTTIATSAKAGWAGGAE